MSTTPPPPEGQGTGWGDGTSGQPSQQPQWGQQPSGSQPDALQYGTPPENAPGAVASLVCGILGFFTIPLVFSIIAIVLGNKSKKATQAEPGRYTDSLGNVGRILGWIGVVLSIIGIVILVIVVVAFLPAMESQL